MPLPADFQQTPLATATLPSRYVTVKNTRLHYVEMGEGDPILLLHGIPANLYLWRNVLLEVRGIGRVIALDLAGFGHSDVPACGGYDANNQYTYLEGFIHALGLTNIALVMTDLGSVLGLNYAANHPENVRGLVVFEGMIMPADEFYDQLSITQKLMYALFRNQRLARWLLVNTNWLHAKIVPMMTHRRLLPDEIQAYAAPYTDKAKREVVFQGPGPVDFPNRNGLKPGQARKESVIMMNENARRLRGTSLPMLILYAKPGAILNEGAITYAKQNYPNLTLSYVGQGKHFLPEDQPETMGRLINDWMVRIKETSSLINMASPDAQTLSLDLPT